MNFYATYPFVGSAATGTVTSVGLALPPEFIVTGSPVTSSGTLTGSWSNETANRLFAGPASGSPGVPSFRTMVAGDIPAAAATSISLLQNDGSGNLSWAKQLQPSSSQFVVVSKGGSDSNGTGTFDNPYLTIAHAMATITDATSIKQYVIYVLPGAYSETTLAMKPYVYIVGDSNQWGGVVTIGVVAGNITLDPSVATMGTRLGLQNVTITAPTGINFDLQSLGGSLSRVFELNDIQVGGNLVFTANGSSDFINISSSFVFGTCQFSGGTVSVSLCNLIGNVTTDTVGTQNSVNVFISTLFYANLAANATGGRLNITELNACGSTTLTASGATSTVYADSISLPPNASITLSSGASISRFTDSYSLLYTPTTSANWNSVPTLNQNALDTLASSGIVKSQSANLFLGSPSGSSGLPSFRTISSGDLPSLVQSLVRYVNFVTGDDSTGDGSFLKPWKSLQHMYNSITPNTGNPYDIYIYGGNNDSGDTGPITGKPNVNLIAQDMSLVPFSLTISGGGNGDVVSFSNIDLNNGFTWVRNDTTTFQVVFNNSSVGTLLDIEQNGSGSVVINALNTTFSSTATLKGISIAVFNACTIYANMTFGDSTTAGYYEFLGGYIGGPISLSGGVFAYFSGVQTDIALAYTLTTVTTGNGSPTIQTDASSIPPSVTGSFTLVPISQSKYTNYVPSASSNWNSIPALDSTALDTLSSSGIVKSQTQNKVLASPNGSSGLPSFRALVAGDIPALPYASSTLTNAHIFVGNGSNVATDVAAGGDLTLANTGAFTVAKIQGTTVSGTTGSTNVVLSSAPTMSNPVVGTQSQGDNSTKAASTAYVDVAIANAVAGVNPAVAVQAATTSASNTSGLTYNNGVGGIGATFTGSNNTALTFDGYTFTALGQRALVKNDTQSPSGAFNGVYYVTQVQTAILPPILTRALDYDMPSDINNTGAIPVINGTVNGTTQWVNTALVNTVGTDPLVFTEFTRNPADYLLKANNLSDVANANTSLNNISPLTTKGDVLTYSTINARLGVGSNGQVLTADSTQTTGIKWATPASSGGGFIGSAYFATTASNTWTRASATLGAFSTNGSTPNPTVEFNPGTPTIQTTNFQLPKIQVNSIPAGYYRVVFEGAALTGPNAFSNIAISDGVTTTGRTSFNVTSYQDCHVEGIFHYTTTANQTFELYGSCDSAGTITLNNSVGNFQLYFYIYQVG